MPRRLPLEGGLEGAVLPLDLARRAVLRFVTRRRSLALLVGRRDARLTMLATAQVAVLFLLAVRAPVALFFLGPLLFGVVHLAADVRYLALRCDVPRALVLPSVGFAVAITALRFAGGGGLFPALQVDEPGVVLGLVWIGLALTVGLAVGRSARRAASAASFFLVAILLAAGHTRATSLAMVHVHNLVALVAWLTLFRRRAGWLLLPVVMVAALTALLVSGATLAWTFEGGGDLAFETHVEELARWLAPGLELRLGGALVVVFVFLQGVHYAAWTGWIPQDALPGEGTPSFRQSLRALRADFGTPALAVMAVVALGMLVAGAVDLRRAVGWYMSLATSHAWFEVAFLAYFVVRGGFRPRPGAA